MASEGQYRGVTTTAPRISVVIPTLCRADLLASCLNALALQSVQPDEVIVVDNGGDPETADLLASRHPGVQHLGQPSNLGFAGGCNAGFAAATGDLLVTLNNDAVPEPGWLAALATEVAAAEPHVGAVGSVLLAPTGRVESAGDGMTAWGIPSQRARGMTWPTSVDRTPPSVCAGAAMYTRAFLDATGGFAEEFFAYYEDVDLCLRGRRLGFTYRVATGAVVRHEGSSTTKRMPGFLRWHTTRNSWWLVLRGIPSPLLLPMLVRLFVLHLVWLLPAVLHRELTISLRAELAAARGVPAALRVRRELARSSPSASQPTALVLDDEPVLRVYMRRLFLGRRTD